MNWLSLYQAFLFDFDGLLVDTEPLHYAAYMQMAKESGFPLAWSFEQFCQEAHGRENGFFHGLQREYPHVFDQGLSKEILYTHKKRLYVERLEKETLSLMEGVEPLLKLLEQNRVKRAVVTNSPLPQIELIQSKLPLLKTIPVWITRERYKQAKPSPEGYLKALDLLGARGERVIGFEDSLKGVRSLLSADVEAVFVCSSRYRSLIEEAQRLGARHLESMSLLLD